MAFLYTPKSGSRIVARDNTTPVVTLANKSHHVLRSFAVQFGGGSRDQRARFVNVASALCQVVGGVAVDDRGDLALYTPNPFAVPQFAGLAGLYVDEQRLAWSLLAEGWAETHEGESYGLSLSGNLRAIPKMRTIEPLVLIYHGHDEKGPLWSYGSARWHSAGVDFKIEPAPTSVAHVLSDAVAVGDRDWRQLARCAMADWSCLTAAETVAEEAARRLAAMMRFDEQAGPTHAVPECDGGREWEMTCRLGILRVVAPDGSVAEVYAQSAERTAHDMLRCGEITVEEAEKLTGCDACRDDTLGVSVGMMDSVETRWTVDDGIMVPSYRINGVWSVYTSDGWEAV